MKKVLLTSAAVLALFASAPVFANQNNDLSNVSVESILNSGSVDARKPAAATKPAASTKPAAPVAQMDKAPKDGYVADNKDNPVATIPDATGDIHAYNNVADNGTLNKVDLSGSQNLTPKGENTYKKYFGHRYGVEGARTNGAEAYKHDQEFLASKGLPTDGDAAKPAAPTMKQSAKDAEKAAEKMCEGKAASKSSSASASKTLPNTAAVK